MKVNEVDNLFNIWNKYYLDNFPFPLDANRKQLERYVVVDGDDKIILFGTIELNPEFIAMSDLGLDIKNRRESYHLLLNKIEHDAKHYGFDNLSCSVNNDNWERHVRSVGFDDPKAKILIKRF